LAAAFLTNATRSRFCTGLEPMRVTARGRFCRCSCLFALGLGLLWPQPSAGEWYVAGQAGVNFADRLKNIQGTGALTGATPLSGPDYDLKNAVAYGGKIGVFPGNGAVGIELDAFHSSPHRKAFVNTTGEYVEGVHLGITNVGLNILFRYPGQTFQPYAGLGGAALIARLGNSSSVRSDSDVGFGFNLIAGIRAFVTPYVAVFTEYKYTQGNLVFDRAFPPDAGFSGDYRAQHVVFGVSYHF
jgi:opacity protein-like surface antigen